MIFLSKKTSCTLLAVALCATSSLVCASGSVIAAQQDDKKQKTGIVAVAKKRIKNSILFASQHKVPVIIAAACGTYFFRRLSAGKGALAPFVAPEEIYSAGIVTLVGVPCDLHKSPSGRTLFQLAKNPSGSNTYEINFCAKTSDTKYWPTVTDSSGACVGAIGPLLGKATYERTNRMTDNGCIIFRRTGTAQSSTQVI